jgi:phage baseplate assembly protein gpV
MIVEDGTVTIKADAIKLDGNVEVTGVLNGDKTGHFSDDVTAGTVSLKTHIHTGVQSGPSTSGPPQP